MVPPVTPGYGTGRTMVSRRVGERWTYPQVAMVGSQRLEDLFFLRGGLYWVDAAVIEDLRQKAR